MASSNPDDLRNFFIKELECPVCFEVPETTPIYQCANQHIHCNICHPKLDRCPICRVPIRRNNSSDRSLLAEKIHEQVLEACKYKECSVRKVGILQLLEHESMCETSRCKVQCNYCKLDISIHNLNTHEDMCKLQPPMPPKKYSTKVEINRNGVLRETSSVVPSSGRSISNATHGMFWDAVQVQWVRCTHCNFYVPARDLRTHESKHLQRMSRAVVHPFWRPVANSRRVNSTQAGPFFIQDVENNNGNDSQNNVEEPVLVANATNIMAPPQRPLPPPIPPTYPTTTGQTRSFDEVDDNRDNQQARDEGSAGVLNMSEITRVLEWL